MRPKLFVEPAVISMRIKVLGEGSLEKKLTVKAHKFSMTAKEKIEAAGGKVEVI